MVTVAHAPPPGVILEEFSALSPKDRHLVANKVAKLEWKAFPSIECLDYDVELKKQNIGMILAFREGNTNQTVAYLVYQRMKSIIWLHKVCVIEQERQKGIGQCLIDALCLRAKRGGGQSIQLWVDEHREPAKALYASCGFQEVEIRPAYYSQDRAGLKMELPLEH
jgi:ribosomal protein S18 acetylase RimI-like enzyme